MAGLDSALATLDVTSRQRLFRLAVWDADYFISGGDASMVRQPIDLMYAIYNKARKFSRHVSAGAGLAAIGNLANVSAARASTTPTIEIFAFGDNHGESQARFEDSALIRFQLVEPRPESSICYELQVHRQRALVSSELLRSSAFCIFAAWMMEHFFIIAQTEEVIGSVEAYSQSRGMIEEIPR